MLKKNNRGLTKSDFEESVKKGQAFFGGDFLISVLRIDGNVKKVGMVVSKKISKKAVTRNKIKRKMMEAISKNFDKLIDGLKLVVVVNKDISKNNQEQLENRIKEVFEKINEKSST